MLYLLAWGYNLKHKEFLSKIQNFLLQKERTVLSECLKLHGVKGIKEYFSNQNKWWEIKKEIHEFEFLYYYKDPNKSNLSEYPFVWKEIATFLNVEEIKEETKQQSMELLDYINSNNQRKINNKLAIVTILSFFITIFSIFPIIQSFFTKNNIIQEEIQKEKTNTIQLLDEE